MIELWSREDMIEVLPDEVANAIHYNHPHEWEHLQEGEDNFTWIVQKKVGHSPIIRLKALDDGKYSREQLIRRVRKVTETVTEYVLPRDY